MVVFQRILLSVLLLSFQLEIRAQAGEWTYMNGSSVGNSLGSFGTQGVSSPLNHPPALYEAAHWTDAQGNFWLFGGATLFGSNDWSDLWKYNPAINEWTWVKGPGIQGQPGFYGTMGVPSPTNNPGSRAWGLLSWNDNNGNFWMYGGFGHDASGFEGMLGDLWMYSPATNEWTWMDGSNLTPGPNPVYGTFQTFSSTVYPGSVYEVSTAWTDVNGKLWFFGGISVFGNVNTMWCYDPAINEWAWMHGSSSANPTASYGTLGVFAAGNHPDGRQSYCGWRDNTGNFWMFGGIGNSNWGDLWEFDPAIKQWAWIGGSTQMDFPGSSGPQCSSAPSFSPAARRENNMCWVDSCGNAWMFGGYHDFSNGVFMNDLWAFSPSSLNWVMTDGGLTGNQPPNFGFMGVSSPTNDPGGRMGCPFWRDADGNFWLYGGWGLNSLIYADLWRYKPDLSCPAFVTCSSLIAPGFAASAQDVCEKFCVSFTDQSTNNPTAWQWYFPGGAPASSALQNPPAICYAVPGTYDVTLITTNASGNDTITLPGYITVNETPPFPVITQNGSTLVSSAAFTYQWQLNSVDIAGATNQSYDIQQSGQYNVVISDSNGCTSSASVYILIEGIEDVNSGADVLIYPNPTKGNLTIELKNNLAGERITINVLNTLGQPVFSSEETITSATWKKEIALKDVIPGIYFIEIKMKKDFVKQKIMVEK